MVSTRTASESVTVNVSSTAATPQTGGSLQVRVNPASGAPGSTATVTVTATDDDGNAAENVTVTLSITGGGGTFSNSSLTTDINGLASTVLTRGSTVGNAYFVTAAATGYTQQSVLTQGERVRITGTTTPTPTPGTAGEPDEIDAYSGGGQSGALNTPLADPFVVEVVDANGRPVEDVRVRFSLTIGTGRFSPRIPRTNASGLASTVFTPTSAGRIRAVATVADVDGTAAFVVTAGGVPETITKVSGDNQTGDPGSALANPFVVEVKDRRWQSD